MPGRIRPVEFDRARNTAQNGSKSVEFIGMIPNLSLNRHGFTPNSTGHKLLVKLGGNSLRLRHHLMKNKYKVTQYI